MEDELSPETLRAYREAVGLSREQLALLSGVHTTTIMRIEKGETDPRLASTWRPIEQALRTRPAPTEAEAA